MFFNNSQSEYVIGTSGVDQNSCSIYKKKYYESYYMGRFRLDFMTDFIRHFFS